MDQNLKNNIASSCRDYLQSHDLTQVDFANKIGIGKEYITHILKPNATFIIDAGKGRTVKIADKYFYRIAKFIGFEVYKTFWKNQPTEQMISIVSNLEDAKKHGQTIVLTGVTGCGKTHVVNLFLRNNPSDTFVVTVGSTDTLNDLIDKIIHSLKLTTGKTKSKRLRDIAIKLKRLNEDGLKPQLIFDEAEYMKQSALASTKELFDYLNTYCSLVLIGTDQLIDNINLLRKKNKAGMPQFYRRIKFGIRTLPSIDKTFKLFLNSVEIPNEVKKFLRRICDNYGELHDVLVPVLRESDRTGEFLSIELIKKVLNLPTNLYE